VDDQDDDGGAWAHQMELEQREREEAALRRGRRMLAVSRGRQARFETEMKALQERIRNLPCKV